MLVPFVSALAISTAVWAQSSTVNCTGQDWSFNAEGDSPCLVWAQLSALCQPNGFQVAPLVGARTAYAPPSTQDACQCSVVAYNLMSACTLCQTGFSPQNLFNESRWSRACTSYNASGVSISHPLVDIPAWAFLSDQGQIFQLTSASQFATSITAASLTASMSIATSSGPAGPFASAASPPSSHKASTGAIVGGVVGSLAGVALLGLLALFIVQWRSHIRSRPAATDARAMHQKPAEFGMPGHLKVQHYRPPSSNGSVDNVPHAHPYAANYAVQRNMMGLSSTASEPEPEPKPYRYPLQPVRGYSTTGNVASIESSLYPRSVQAHIPSPVSSPAHHPFANPLHDDDYDHGSEPLTPFGRLEPVRRTPTPHQGQLPQPSRGSPLPPLRTPQPQRHYSSSGTEFEPSSFGSNSSSYPSRGGGPLQTASSIEKLLSRGKQVQSAPKSSRQDWQIE